MKTHTIWTLKYSNFALKNSNFKLQLKCASTQPKKYQLQIPIDDVNEAIQMTKPSERKALFLPKLSSSILQQLGSVTSVTVALNHVSWAKISIPDLTVSNWNYFTLPSNFSHEAKEHDILTIAKTVKTKIPSSDLYVMESRSHRRSFSLNDICLRSTLIALLSDLKYDQECPKIVFQKPSLINTLHSLTVGGERISTTELIKTKILCRHSETTGGVINQGSNDIYSLITIWSDQENTFQSSFGLNQESLSLALLTAMTFLDVAVFQNPESISKIHTKQRKKKITGKFAEN